MSKPSLLHALALIACTCIIATPTPADDLLGGLGLFGGGLGLPEVQQCLTSILGVNGCLQELIFSVLNVQPRILGPACCKASLEINEACWSKVFPLNQTFPADIKNYCAAIEDAPATPPPPPLTPPPPPCSDDDDDNDSNEGGDCDND